MLAAMTQEETLVTPYLIPDNDETFRGICVPMYRATMCGDWEAASRIIEGRGDVIRSSITREEETPLHLASAVNGVAFVRNLLRIMQRNDLALRNRYGRTALFYAAQAGGTDIIRMMIARNPDLPIIPGNQGEIPLMPAITFGHRDTVAILFESTEFDRINDSTMAKLFHGLISSGLFDFAVTLFDRNTHASQNTLATTRDSKGYTALHLMAVKPNAFSPNRRFFNFFHGGRMPSLVSDLIDRLWEPVLRHDDGFHLLMQPTNFIFDAAAAGNAEFLASLLSRYPDLLFTRNEYNQTLFHTAAINRHESVFGMIFEIGAAKNRIIETIDNTGCNILHHVAKLPPHDRLQVVAGAAFQMQRELLWFEVVKKMVPRAYIESKTGEHKETADVIFAREHQNLRKQGEEWFKGTSTTCMIVATLIAASAFALAINVPGGFDKEGFPVLGQNDWFHIFFVGAAVAFICLSLSILLFTSILTSRFATDEFRAMLPLRMMFGLLMLFVSIVAMVTSFCASVIIMHHSRIAWKLSTLICLSLLIGLSFIVLHFTLFFGMLRAAYWSKFFFKLRRHKLFV